MYNGAIHRACGGAERWSRNGGHTAADKPRQHNCHNRSFAVESPLAALPPRRQRAQRHHHHQPRQRPHLLGHRLRRERPPRRILSWKQQDQLGRTTLLRSYVPGGDQWTLESEISLTYGAADHLTQTYRRDGGQGRWQCSSGFSYDSLGRRTGMSDADLGNWSYANNTLGLLMRQTDARDKTSCIYYDSLGRMRGRVQRTDENCASAVTDASYAYDSYGRVRVSPVTAYPAATPTTATADSATRPSPSTA